MVLRDSESELEEESVAISSKTDMMSATELSLEEFDGVLRSGVLDSEEDEKIL